MAEERREARMPTEEELREALDRVAIGDVLVQSLTAAVSLGFRRVSREARDLRQARLAIEALRALEPVLREGGVEEQVVRDLEQARVNLQLAFAKAVSEEEATPAEEGREQPRAAAEPAPRREEPAGEDEGAAETAEPAGEGEAAPEEAAPEEAAPEPGAGGGRGDEEAGGGR
ncbi:MAG TPA: hypothetical protein VNJ46_02385 [Gaiellaceae bacterium]|nr:hypothetical protein [Gaiellaceae bacterium]